MKQININCDVGEGLNNEAQIMPYIQSCNIACGAHAGDEQTISTVIDLAILHNVKIGAHPSYPDKINFGRKSIIISDDKLILSIQQQMNAILKIIQMKDSELHHIKPHGALYNDIAKSESLSLVFLEAIISFKNKAYLYVPFNSEIERQALKNGFQIKYEAFADRNYNDDLSLVSRTQENALLTDVDVIENHILLMLNKQKVKTVANNEKHIMADTFCVHSDTKYAIEIVKQLHKKFSI